MGCCESSEQDDIYAEPSERGPLLGSGSSIDRSGQHHNATDGVNGQQKSDEQSALNRILQQTSNSLIDISAQALSADIAEESEAQYRGKHYTAKLNKVTIATQPRIGTSRSNPFNILSQPAIPPSDLDLVAEAAQKTAQCMKKVIVHHKEDLVVPFGVP